MLSQRTVRPDGVVVTAPTFDDPLGFFQGIEDVSIKSCVPQFAIQRFAVAVFPWACRCDVKRLGDQPFQPSLWMCCNFGWRR